MTFPDLSKCVVFLLLVLSLSLPLLQTSATAQEQPAARRAAALPEGFRELLELRQKEQRGLTFIVHGQHIGGIVVKVHGEEAVEVRNQTHRRLIIRLDRVDALGLN